MATVKKTQLVILFCLLTALISAQDSFVVYSTKGNVTILEKNKSFNAKPGKTISSNGSVEIHEEAGITLICKEGCSYSFTQPGFHSLNKIKDSCHKTNSSVLNNFFKYIWDQAINQNREPGKYRKAYFDNIRVVIRDFADIWVSRAFDTLNYSGVGGVFSIYWKSYIDAKEYEFSLYADGNTVAPFYRTNVMGMKIPVVDLAPQIKPGNTYYWSVSIKGEIEDPLYVLNYVTNEAFDIVLKNINKQKPAVEGQAEEAFRTAFMLENAHYLAEAYQYYTKAAVLDSRNVLYRSALKSFKKDYEIK
jgi:hypothetical protein